MNSSSRKPPQNLEAEEGVLGAILLDNAVLPEVATFLRPTDFFRESHQVAYRAILDLTDVGKPVDCKLLADELIRRGEFERMGGDDLLVRFMDSVPHAANAVYHAGIVREKAVGRALIRAAEETLEDCYGQRMTAGEALGIAEGRFFAIGDAAATGDTRPIGALVGQAMDRFARRAGGEYSGISTGFTDLDGITDGLAKGSLVILAARPSMGKTALGLQVAEAAAVDSGIPVLFVSLEMAALELAERLLISRARVNGHHLRTGIKLGPDAAASLDRAAHDLRRCGRLWIDDTPIRTAGQIAANARRQKARHKIGLVVIDYIQLIDGGTDVAHRANRQEQVAAISRRLKCLAKELDVPVLCLSQLNRQSEGREDHRPRLSDLRDSGALEQDADMVLLLHRPECLDPTDQPGMAELVVAKNRNGATGMLKLTFLKSLTRFEDRPDDGTTVDPEVD